MSQPRSVQNDELIGRKLNRTWARNEAVVVCVLNRSFLVQSQTGITMRLALHLCDFFSGRDCWMKFTTRDRNSGTDRLMNSLCKAFCCLHPQTDPFLHCFDLISRDSRWKTRLMHFVVILRVKDIRREALNSRANAGHNTDECAVSPLGAFEARDLLVSRLNSFCDNVNAVIVAGIWWISQSLRCNCFQLTINVKSWRIESGINLKSALGRRELQGNDNWRIQLQDRCQTLNY